MEELVFENEFISIYKKLNEDGFYNIYDTNGKWLTNLIIDSDFEYEKQDWLKLDTVEKTIEYLEQVEDFHVMSKKEAIEKYGNDYLDNDFINVIGSKILDLEFYH